MRRSARTAALAAALAAAACASPDPAPQPSGATEFFVEGMSWILRLEDPQGAQLHFGVPESDHILLTLTCRPRARQVQVSVFEAPDRPVRRLHLASGEAELALRARTQESMLYDRYFEASAPAGAAVFDRFAQTGRLELGIGAGPAPLPPADPAEARRFVDLCRP